MSQKIEGYDKEFEDEQRIIYVNGSYHGEDEFGALMRDFRSTRSQDIRNKNIRRQYIKYKEEEKGRKEMVGPIKEFYDEVYAQGKDNGFNEGERTGILKSLKNLVNHGVELSTALKMLDIPPLEHDYYISRL